MYHSVSLGDCDVNQPTRKERPQNIFLVERNILKKVATESTGGQNTDVHMHL